LKRDIKIYLFIFYFSSKIVHEYHFQEMDYSKASATKLGSEYQMGKKTSFVQR